MNKPEHLLVCLAEECAEVQKAVSKALRFGLDDHHPDSATDNRADIGHELTDLLAVVEMLVELGIINSPESADGKQAKKSKVEKYMAYAAKQGTLNK